MGEISPFASRTVARHLVRGVLGFGSFGLAMFALPAVGPAALLLLLLGVVALRGCPMCWMVGLAETISLGRMQRDCEGDACTLTFAKQVPSAPPTVGDRRGDKVAKREAATPVQVVAGR